MNGRLFSRRPGRIIMSTETRDGAPALMRLLQLSSPMLPVGAYAYSQGLEHAVHAGWVRDERTAHVWIGGVLRGGLMRLDVPVLARLYHAWHMADGDAGVSVGVFGIPGGRGDDADSALPDHRPAHFVRCGDGDTGPRGRGLGIGGRRYRLRRAGVGLG